MFFKEKGTDDTRLFPFVKERKSKMKQGNEYVVPITTEELLEILPHRYPFLMVDKIIEMEKGKRIVGIKNVTVNEPHFQGHFPGKPIMPGVLILEAMAQTGAVLIMSEPEHRGKLAYFATIENVKFRKPVLPGDQLRLEVTVLKFRMSFGKVEAKAYVGDTLVTEAQIGFVIGV